MLGRHVLLCSFLICLGSFCSARINWGKCDEITYLGPNTPRARCGIIQVPRSYSDPGSGSIKLNLVRIPARKRHPSGQRKTILYNPGGPGFSGRSAVVLRSRFLQRLTGGIFDLVSFDIRGTGANEPLNCFPNATSRNSIYNKIQADPNSDHGLKLALSGAKEFSDACSRDHRATAETMNAAYMARDLISISEALEEDGKLRYWGLSWGTVPGVVVAKMFPVKIDKVVLEAVVDVKSYYDFTQALRKVEEGDILFKRFLLSCLANRSKCVLADQDHTLKGLQERIIHALSQLQTAPARVHSTTVTHYMVLNMILARLTTTGGWQSLARLLKALITENYDRKFYGEFIESYFAPQGTQAWPRSLSLAHLSSYRCTDSKGQKMKSLGLKDARKMRDSLQALGDLSADYWFSHWVMCSDWTVGADERFEDGADVETSTPALFLQNSFDMRTPLDGAKKQSKAWKDSGFIRVEYQGHLMPPLDKIPECVVLPTVKYWMSGEVPEEHKICRVKEEPWVRAGWISNSWNSIVSYAREKFRYMNAWLLSAATD